MDPLDIVVIGSGPNGLVAANVLARQGLRVLVLEANSRRPGGALGTEDLTRPGFLHDVGAAFFPFASRSPAFAELELERFGLEWLYAPIDSCHPALDGSCASIARDPEFSRQHFGSPEDGEAWVKLCRAYADIEAPLLDVLLGTLLRWRPLLRLRPDRLLGVMRYFLQSGEALARSLFQSAAAQRVLPALGLHADTGPTDRFGAGLGYMLGMLASASGYPVARRGAQSITNALVTALEYAGGRLRLNARVERIIVRRGVAEAVRLADGEEIRAARAVVADTAAPALLLKLVGPEHLSRYVARKARRFRAGWGTFKADFALLGVVPWREPLARESAVVHTGENLADLARFTAEVRQGSLPAEPYLVIGQQSLWDPERAPPGQHTLYCYSHAPSQLKADWSSERERFADAIEARIEGLAPGFRGLILARHLTAPPDFEAQNANLVGGDHGGGSNVWTQQLIFRPFFPYFRYRMPIRQLYLCSSATHPGAGVHGMCGYNAARAVLSDLG